MKFCFEKKDFIELEKAADQLAVIGEDYALSWAEFRTEVDELCTYFQSIGLHKSHRSVLVYGHKSARMIISIYALIKLEVAYIPLDIVYPKARVAKIAELSEAKLLINTGNQKLELKGITEVLIGEKEEMDLPFEDTSTCSNDPVVYTIFTSGSTGEPKGVQISTEAVQSFSRWMSNDFGFTAKDVFVNTAPLSFDLSVYELITFASVGGTLLLNAKETSANPDLFLDRIAQYKGSVLVSTPSFMLLYARLKNESRLATCHTLLFCGEVLPHDLAQKLLKHYPKSKILNTYGPTEATVATTLVEINQEVLASHNPLPVGRVKRESQLLIEEDEIVIVGPNVSIGYLNNQTLNQQKFTIRNGQRAFKTGDKGYLNEGMLFFKGRADDLIKLHGYRIELNEINKALNQIEEVKVGAAVALKRNEVVKKIVAVIQANGAIKIKSEHMKTQLSKLLPAYMIPSDFKIVKEIPLNQNGKIDQKILAQLYLQSN